MSFTLIWTSLSATFDVHESNLTLSKFLPGLTVSERGATYRLSEQVSAFAFNESKANLIALTKSFHGLYPMIFTA